MGYNMTAEVRERRQRIAEERWRTAPWEQVPKARQRDRILLEQDNQCAACGIPPVWNGKPLTFQLDHLSGDRADNSRPNLRLICPNCHVQTPTWGARNASVEGKARIREALLRGLQTQWG